MTVSFSLCVVRPSTVLSLKSLDNKLSLGSYGDFKRKLVKNKFSLCIIVLLLFFSLNIPLRFAISTFPDHGQTRGWNIETKNDNAIRSFICAIISWCSNFLTFCTVLINFRLRIQEPFKGFDPFSAWRAINGMLMLNHV